MNGTALQKSAARIDNRVSVRDMVHSLMCNGLCGKVVMRVLFLTVNGGFM